MYKIWTILFTLNAFLLPAQNRIIDSLQQVLKDFEAEKLELRKNLPRDEGDTTKVKILNILSWQYMVISDYTAAKKIANEALVNAQQIGFQKGIAKIYNTMGVIHWYEGDYSEALKYHFASLKIKEEIGDKKGMSSSYNNIGIIYRDLGNYPEALKNHLASLKTDEEIGDKKGVAASYNNIGVIYKDQGNYPEALKSQLASLEIRKEIGDSAGMADSYCNLGNIYLDQGIYPEALNNHFAALNLMMDIGDKNGIATAYTNIGNVFAEQKNYAEALKNHFAALKICEEIGYKSGMATCYLSIGSTKLKMQLPSEARDWLIKGLQVAKEIDAVPIMEKGYEQLAYAESALGNYKGAYEHYKLFVQYRDNLKNEETAKNSMQTKLQYAFDKKEAEAKIASDALLHRQKLVRNGFMGGFSVVLLFAVVFFWQRNKTIKEKKRAVEEKKRAEEEKQRSEELLLNILPKEVADEIKATGKAKAKAFTMVTVMFTDFKDFTTLSEKISAELLVDELHTCFSAFDNVLRNYKIEKIKTIGDAYLCASGLPVSNYSHATDMLYAALNIRSFILERKKEKEAKGEIPFELRIGIHTGPVVAGVVGIKKYGYDIWGDTVNLAARMEQNSEAGKINISGSTYKLVKDKFNCVYRGKIETKNKGKVDMYFVDSVK